MFNKRKTSNDPHSILGKEVPAADGGNYGLRILGYDFHKKDYIVISIRWSTGEVLDSKSHDIDEFKISYRYKLEEVRNILE